MVISQHNITATSTTPLKRSMDSTEPVAEKIFSPVVAGSGTGIAPIAAAAAITATALVTTVPLSATTALPITPFNTTTMNTTMTALPTVHHHNHHHNHPTTIHSHTDLFSLPGARRGPPPPLVFGEILNKRPDDNHESAKSQLRLNSASVSSYGGHPVVMTTISQSNPSVGAADMQPYVYSAGYPPYGTLYAQAPPASAALRPSSYSCSQVGMYPSLAASSSAPMYPTSMADPCTMQYNGASIPPMAHATLSYLSSIPAVSGAGRHFPTAHASMVPYFGEFPQVGMYATPAPSTSLPSSATSSCSSTSSTAAVYASETCTDPQHLSTKSGDSADIITHFKRKRQRRKHKDHAAVIVSSSCSSAATTTSPSVATATTNGYQFKPESEIIQNYLLPNSPDAIETDPVARFELVIRQQPMRGRMVAQADKDRPPLDPFPVLQVRCWNKAGEAVSGYKQAPFLVVVASLWREDRSEEVLVVRPADHGCFLPERALLGSTVNASYELGDEQGERGLFFVFPDLRVVVEGVFRLKFSLLRLSESLELQSEVSCPDVHVFTDAFEVYSAKRYPGSLESTDLTRHLASQGIRLPLRKEARYLPRGYAMDRA